MKPSLQTIAIILAFVDPAFAHPGGLDSKGGHHNRKTGEYHYHRGGGNDLSSLPIERPPKEVAPPKNETPTFRISARETANTSARMEYRSAPELPIAFLFHMKSSEPRPVADFVDNGEFWRVTQRSGKQLNYPKQ